MGTLITVLSWVVIITYTMGVIFSLVPMFYVFYAFFSYDG